MARIRKSIILAGAAIFLAIPASALSFDASSGNLAANVTFSIVAISGDANLANGNYLQVILTNTSTADVLVPADVLTAVFFSYDGPALTPGSAYLTVGSLVLFDSAPPDGNVGGEWAYVKPLSGPNGSNAGISSSGFGLFGDANFYNFNNLQDPDALDGLQYGITSAGDLSGTGNAPVTGANALIQNSVTFLLGGVGDTSLANLHIWNVSFQYGTDLTEPNIPSDDPGQPVPEPATWTLMGIGLAAFTVREIRRKAKNAS
ncbi:MAG: PEP-CTERM sorting domain-containing protein [Candidatus Hydrogenedentes bacterium]|nr:PEP-CTERM sorting domain-containing protein [Candidatus Hydrogenedentota bacterium]